MKRTSLFVATIVLATLGMSNSARAQISGSGLFGGSRNVGGGTIQAGNRNAFGDSSAVGGTAGSRLDQLGNTGQITGSERFLRENRTAAQFVGADSADSSFVGALSGGATSGLGGFGGFGAGGFGGRANRNNRGNTNQANNNRSVNVRTKLTVGFEYRRRNPTTVQSRLSERLNKVSRGGRLDVQLAERTVTLQGIVASESDRALLVQLARLEPGVEMVRDELTISGERPNPLSPPDP